MLNISIPIDPALKVKADSVAASKGTTLGNVLAEFLHQWVSSQSLPEMVQHPLFETVDVFNVKMRQAKKDMLADRVYSIEESRSLLHTSKNL